MDPVEKITPPQAQEMTLGELVSYYYEKLADVYENEELRALAVATIVKDIIPRA